MIFVRKTISLCLLELIIIVTGVYVANETRNLYTQMEYLPFQTVLLNFGQISLEACRFVPDLTSAIEMKMPRYITPFWGKRTPILFTRGTYHSICSTNGRLMKSELVRDETGRPVSPIDFFHGDYKLQMLKCKSI